MANTLTLCSAGHPPVFLRRADGRVEELCEDISGFPLGIMPEWEYKSGRGRTSTPATSSIVYSDGVTDARSPGRGDLRLQGQATA